MAVSEQATGCALCECRSFEGKPYMFCPDLTTWQVADGVCAEHGMRLARIASAEENAWVRATADELTIERLWFGANDRAEEGVWRWLDDDLVMIAGEGGAPSSYHAFPGEEPNRGRGSNCGNIWDSGSWHDQPCEYEQAFVCSASAP